MAAAGSWPGPTAVAAQPPSSAKPRIPATVRLFAFMRCSFDLSRSARGPVALLELLPRPAPARIIPPQLRRLVHDRRRRSGRAMVRVLAAACRLHELLRRPVQRAPQLEDVADRLRLLEVIEVAREQRRHVRDRGVLLAEAPR